MSDAPPAAAIEGDGGTPPEGAATPREWMTSLPDGLKADASLARFEDVPSLAKSYVELRSTMGNRLAVPAADAPPEEWGKVWDALGRPKEAAGYEFPDGVHAETAEMFRPIAHQLGLNPAQAKALAEFDMQRIEGFVTKANADSAADLQTLKDELGNDYEPKRLAAKAVVEKIFGEESADFLDELDDRVGSRKLVEGMMKLSDLVGETPRVDGDGGRVTGASDAEAEATLKGLQKDPAWREKLTNKDAATVAEHSRLLEAAQRHAAAGLA